MYKSGGSWRWPAIEDKIFYMYEQVVKKLSPPEVVGCRGQFKFEELK